MYVLNWLTANAITRGLFWYVFPEVHSYEGNKHQHSTRVTDPTSNNLLNENIAQWEQGTSIKIIARHLVHFCVGLPKLEYLYQDAMLHNSHIMFYISTAMPWCCVDTILWRRLYGVGNTGFCHDLLSALKYCGMW